MSIYSSSTQDSIQSLFFGLSMLGNPANSFKTIRKGFKDFFYEPTHRYIETKSPKEFFKVLKNGIVSLPQNTAGGVLNTVENLLGSVNSLVKSVSMDRDVGSNVNKSKNVSNGLQQGFMKFGMGILKGVQGVVMDPINVLYFLNIGCKKRRDQRIREGSSKWDKWSCCQAYIRSRELKLK